LYALSAQLACVQMSWGENEFSTLKRGATRPSPDHGEGRIAFEGRVMRPASRRGQASHNVMRMVGLAAPVILRSESNAGHRSNS
jgi:hypothetical protein